MARLREKEILAFREILAETGMEMTPEDAEKAYDASRSIFKASRRMSTMDMWIMEEEDLEGVSKEERKRLVDLYRSAKEM